jgi:hypothetical protein
MNKNAVFSPYAFAICNPIEFIDLNGEWLGITFMYFEFEVGGGVVFGLNYVEQSGIAYDEVGKTHFITTSALHLTNQNLNAGSTDPQGIIGLSISLSANIKFNWSYETFYGLIGKGGIGTPIPTSGKLGLGVTLGVGFSSDDFTFSFGYGAGIKITYLNTTVKESVSLTNKEADIVSESTNVIFESWIVNNSIPVKDSEGKTISFEATLATNDINGKLIDTGIKLSSEVMQDKYGNTVSNGVWMSEEYKKQSKKEESN